MELLKLALESAEGVTRARASVCNGICLDRDNLACSAASLADLAACSGEGEGSGLEMCSSGKWSGKSAISAAVAAVAVDDWCRKEVQNGDLDATNAPGRATHNWLLHLDSRNPFIKSIDSDAHRAPQGTIGTILKKRLREITEMQSLEKFLLRVV